MIALKNIILKTRVIFNNLSSSGLQHFSMSFAKCEIAVKLDDESAGLLVGIICY